MPNKINWEGFKSPSNFSVFHFPFSVFNPRGKKKFLDGNAPEKELEHKTSETKAKCGRLRRAIAMV